MKDVELKLISELMKNSRRNDRDLAKAIGVSQPTVTRIRSRLEKEGVIKEYTVIPDFSKLGYEIMALTLVKLHASLKPEEVEKARMIAKESLTKSSFDVVMLERGVGLGYDGVIISYHQNYASYLDFINMLKQFDFLELRKIDSFLVNLNDDIHYRSLTFSCVANCLRLQAENKE